MTEAINPPAGSPEDMQPREDTAAGLQLHTHEQLKPLSDPSSARARMEAIVAAFGLLVGAMTDWFGIAAVCYLAPLQHWSPEMTFAAIGVCASGAIVAKAKGKVAGSTSAAIMTGPTLKLASVVLGSGAASRMIALVLACAVALSGCAGLTPPPVDPRAMLDELGADVAAICSAPILFFANCAGVMPSAAARSAVRKPISARATADFFPPF